MPYIEEIPMSDQSTNVSAGPPPLDRNEAQQAIQASAPPQPPRPLQSALGMRLWIPLIFIGSLWAAMRVPAYFVPGTPLHIYGTMMAPMVATLGVLVWWLFLSRVRWRDRFLGLAVFIGAGAATYPLMDESINLFGVIIAMLPVVLTVWVLCLAVTWFLTWPPRRTIMLAAIVLTWCYFTTVRFEGVTGVFSSQMSYRWTLTGEQKHLASAAADKLSAAKELDAAAKPTLVLQKGDWPGFRGPDRDGRLQGVKIATDWDKDKPKKLWSHRVGPGWSSFAVVGKYLFTQEQLRDEEMVVCYDAETGDVIWAHKDTARFHEGVGGDGPRATPTFHNGKLYVQGATGILNCLDAATGRKVWSVNIADDSGAKVPMWGFASSPLVYQGVVTVFAGGPDGKSVLGYDEASGKLLWQRGEGTHGYCSLQPARLGGVDQILVTSDHGMTAFQPKDGNILWDYPWVLDGMQRVVQPAILSDSDVLLGSPFGKGTRRLHLDQKGTSWEPNEVWTTRAISPYFNDLVIHDGHLYGFDGDFLTCVSLDNGKKKWRERGYGNGQVLLLADQSLLLVLTETGDVALVEAAPIHKELGRFKAIEGKTWNHPVVAHGKLYVRNGEEIACFELKANEGTK
jgi:outer membrane protein assembly factor BamB